MVGYIEDERQPPALVVIVWAQASLLQCEGTNNIIHECGWLIVEHTFNFIHNDIHSLDGLQHFYEDMILVYITGNSG